METDLGCAREMLGLVAALSVHDRRTRGHSERVRIFTDMLADELGLPEEARSRLRWASLLHDVGKIHVPADVLNKPARPTAHEWEVLQRHPADGARMIAPLMSWLGPWALAVEQHHERWDGTGYPRRLAGEEISLGGRVVAVADAFETMTAARPYKRALSVAAARQELVACSGGQFDPVVVRAFLTISLGRLWRVVGIGAWVSQVPTFATVLDGLGRAGVHVAARGATAATALGLVAGGAALAPPSSPHPTASAGDPGPVAAGGPLSQPGIAADGVGTDAPSPAGGGGGNRASSSPTPTGRATPLPGPATPTPPTGLWTTAGHLGVSTRTALSPGDGLGPVAPPAVPVRPSLPSLPGVTGAVPTVLDDPRLPLSLPSLLDGQGR
jgi:HD domain